MTASPSRNNDIIEAVAVVIQAGRPPLIWGKPGIGKTSIIAAITKQLGVPLKVIIAALREPTDFLGLPQLVDGRTKYLPPDWAWELNETGGVLFLDEISCAPPSVQNALLRVVHERCVGDSLALKPNVFIAAAANPPDQITSGFNLTAPLASRFIHFHLELNAEEWSQGMINGWPTLPVPTLPSDWKEKFYPSMRALIGGYIKIRPDKVIDLPKDETQAGLAWPTGRTWDLAAEMLAAAKSANCPFEVEVEILRGCVGAAAVEFYEWLEKANLPDPEDLLANPTTAKLPREADILLVTLATLNAAVLQRNTRERWFAACKILGRALDITNAPDIPAVFARDLWRREHRPEDLDMANLPTEFAKFRPIFRAAGIGA